MLGTPLAHILVYLVRRCHLTVDIPDLIILNMAYPIDRFTFLPFSAVFSHNCIVLRYKDSNNS